MTSELVAFLEPAQLLIVQGSLSATDAAHLFLM